MAETTDRETRPERRSIEGRGSVTRGRPTQRQGRWKPVLLVGIDWADTEHVYCLMDEAALSNQPLAERSLEIGLLTFAAFTPPAPRRCWAHASGTATPQPEPADHWRP